MRHKLPMRMGLGLGALALLASLGADFMGKPDGDVLEMLAKGCVWAGVSCAFGAVMGYFIFLALGGHEDPEADSPDELFDDAPDAMPGVAGSLVDLTAGDEDLEPPIEPVSELDGFSAEEISRAVQSQLRSEDEQI